MGARTPSPRTSGGPPGHLAMDAAHERVRGACAAVVEWAVGSGDLVPGPGLEAPPKGVVAP